MADNKGGVLTVPKGVARGHILCCCAVVFICFMLTCLNLYMLSSTRSVLRRLDARLDAHPRNLNLPSRGQLPQLPDPAAAAAATMMQLQQQQLQQLEQLQPEGSEDFILLAPSDLDNAWTTQTGRLLVPVGQPEDNDDGWKQMQRQLAEQTSQQQRHIETLHDKLADQYRAREELQRDQQELLRHHQELSQQQQRQLAKKERQLLRHEQRALRTGAKHEDQLRRVQSEMQELKKVVEAVQSLDPAGPAGPAQQAADATPMPASSTNADSLLESVPSLPKQDADGASTSTETVVQVTVPAGGDEDVVGHPLGHIFSAVFGPSPGSFFFPSYPVGAEQAEAAATAAGAPPTRMRRDLTTELKDLKEKRERRLARLTSRLGSRRRRHNQADDGPLMRIDDGELVPLSPLNTPVVAAEDDAQRRRRHAAHRSSRLG